MDFNALLGKAIFAARCSLGWSQGRLVREAGDVICRAWLSALERGRYPFDGVLFSRLARAMGREPLELLNSAVGLPEVPADRRRTRPTTPVECSG